MKTNKDYIREDGRMTKTIKTPAELKQYKTLLKSEIKRYQLLKESSDEYLARRFFALMVFGLKAELRVATLGSENSVTE